MSAFNAEIVVFNARDTRPTGLLTGPAQMGHPILNRSGAQAVAFPFPHQSAQMLLSDTVSTQVPIAKLTELSCREA
ncbi:hypothetical protein D480_0224780 [Pseudomonas aeruginosa]|nr:hypothetical protein D480_0224780 [Pseudomonas aeruginosa]